MGPAFAIRGMKKGPTQKSDRFFNIKKTAWLNGKVPETLKQDNNKEVSLIISMIVGTSFVIILLLYKYITIYKIQLVCIEESLCLENLCYSVV